MKEDDKELITCFEVLQWECPKCESIQEVDYFSRLDHISGCCINCGYEVKLRKD